MKHITFLILLFIGFNVLKAETYKVETGQFDKIKVNGNISVVYKNLTDSTGMACYDAPVGSSRMFDIEVNKNGLLKVSPGDDNWSAENLPTLYVYSDFLTSVESYSDQEVQVAGLAPCASFKISLIGNGTIYAEGIRSTSVSASISTGNGSIYLSGKCDKANFRMVGTGLISADRLQALDVKCNILGTGSIGCWPVDNLNVSGLGSTKIYYKGTPHISKKGGGKLFELPSNNSEGQGTEVRSFNPSREEE